LAISVIRSGIGGQGKNADKHSAAVNPESQARDQRILVGRKRCSEVDQRTMAKDFPSHGASERQPPRASCSWQRKKGKIDPSHFFACSSGAGEAPADGLDDRVAPPDFAGDVGLLGAVFGGSPDHDRTSCSSSARGHSDGKSRRACRRCGKYADVKRLRSWWPSPSRLAGGAGQRRPIMAGWNWLDLVHPDEG
jgi:hypothetical protein